MNSVHHDRVTRGAVPWWGVASSATAPLALGAGWTIADRLQPRHYDAISQTVSVLAAHGASDRWVMTLALLIVGGCDVITGLALRPAARPGRIIIIAGGIGGMLVGLNPETIGAGGSVPHELFAAIGFIALTIWPFAARRVVLARGDDPPEPPAVLARGDGPAGTTAWALRPATATAATALIAALFGWFGVELLAGGGQLGLAERGLGELQALWPLAVVASCLAADRARRRDRRASQIPASGTSSKPQ